MVEKDKNIDNSIKVKQLEKAPVFNQVTKNTNFALLRNCVFPLAEGDNINSRSEYYSACQQKAKALQCNQAKKARHKPRLRKKKHFMNSKEFFIAFK